VASSDVVMVRMNKELAAAFNRLRQEFQGLPPSTIARMIVTATLALPLDRQIEIVNSQVRKPGSLPGAGLAASRHAPKNTVRPESARYERHRP